MSANDLAKFADRAYRVGGLVDLYCEAQLNGLCRAIVAGGPTLGTNDGRMTECGMKLVFAALAAQTPASAPTVDSHGIRLQEMGELVDICNATWEYARTLRVPLGAEFRDAFNALEHKLLPIMDSEGVQ